ncbi:MAG: methyltransferase domain-containing protein [Candidatus Eisenbacteria bacterium]|jgi:ubiquinone/menaquinone biosynthesis C-methylase UbiE|nr:methyltransferase domain-containing protein [Candidatus Eisenbacteria bacterium]
MHERRFKGRPDRLRSEERLARLEVERVVDRCLEGTGIRRVLDIGTGTGVFAEAFSGRGCEVAGVDPNPDLLAEARRHVPEAEFSEATAEALPFPDKQFDLAFIGAVLHETDDAVAALREARRVTVHMVVVLEFPFVEEDEGPPLHHRLPPEAIEDLARQAGYALVQRLALPCMDLYLMTP